MVDVLEVKNPATGRVIKEVRLNTTEEIQQALKNGHEGFKTWAKVNAHERSRLLKDWSAKFKSIKKK